MFPSARIHITLLAGLVFLLMSSVAPHLSAQSVSADDVLGVWYTEGNKSKVRIYEENGRYHGEIIWLKNPTYEDGTQKIDKNNPSPLLRRRPLIGLNIIKDFEFDGDDEWEDGTIYDPENGEEYSCYMEFEDPSNKDKLKVRGYIGVSLIGRTTYWNRVE